MPDFFKKCHLNSKKCFVLFQTKRTNSYIKCSYQQQVILSNCLFIKLGLRIKADCSNRSLAIDDGTGLSSKFVADAILAEQEKELAADHPYFFPRWC